MANPSTAIPGNAGSRHRVLILGGGFGGLAAAQSLKNAAVDITLVDRRNFHLFQPLLYQVAAGALSPGEIAAPIRAVLNKQKNVQVLLGEATGIDPQAQRVTLRDGAELAYDSLIVATGSQSAYFGHEEWRQNAPPLKSVEDAIVIRHKILVAFEAAERISDPDQRRAWLTFVIVGAGATGVELAGTLGEISNYTLKHDFRSIRPGEAQIIVIDSGPRVLAAYPEDLSRRAEMQLLKLGARVRTGLTVTGITPEGVALRTREGEEFHIPSHTVIWAAGVGVSAFGRELAARTGAETDRAGRIKVNSDLTIPNFPGIFVVGDLALSSGSDGKPLPGVAQVAMQGGSYVAKTILQRLTSNGRSEPFRYFDKGNLAVIGRAAAVADVFGVHLSGFPAWLVWVFIHLIYIVEFQSRIVVLVKWALQYFTFSRSARLITGEGTERTAT